jgi:hypothetical protein
LIPENAKGSPLCATNLSFNKIRFDQYWTGVVFRFVSAEASATSNRRVEARVFLS